MAETVIFAEQTLEFTEGIYEVIPAPFELVAGATYRVVWNGVEHECVCAEENGYSFLTDLQEDDGQIVAVSFDIFYGNADIVGVDGGAVAMAAYISGTFDLDTTTPTHTVAIYQAADDSTGGETEESGPADAVILNYSQDPVIYKDIPKVWLTHADSTEEDVSLIPFTYGEAVSKTVVPDFSAGNMDVPIAAGELVTALIVEQPEDLIPANIPEGKYIAGVGPGEYADATEEVTVGDTEDGDTYDLDFAEGDIEILPTADKVSMSKVTIIKPDTLVPENVRQGVTIGGVEGGLVAEAETEEVEVDLNLAGGDQEVLPSEDGLSISKVVIKKPETLVPGNIAAGKYIAGVLGTLSAGSNVVVKTGSFTGVKTGVTVSHALGVIPDVFIAWYSASSPIAGYSYFLVAIGPTFVSKYSTPSQFVAWANSSKYLQLALLYTSIAYTGTTPFSGATTVAIKVGSSVYPLVANVKYNWIAIGGLT